MFFLLLLFTISLHYSIGSAGDGQEEEEEQQIQEQQLHITSKTPIIETVKKMFSFPQTSANYWSRFESLIKQGKAYFSPPTLE